MKPAPFQYERPDTVDGVLAVLEKYGDDSKILAGGQSLVAMMNTRVVQPRVVVDINHVPGLDSLAIEGDALVIGALVRHSEVAGSPAVREACPLLAEAYPYLAHLPVRNRGTLAGNLAHADPASEMPAVMLVSGASMTLRSHNNMRTLDADNFFVGPFETAAQPDELLTEISIPLAPAGQGYGFAEFSPRKGDFALAAVAAVLSIDGGQIDDVRIACAGVGPRARRIADAEDALTGAAPDADAFAEAARIAVAAIDPQDDYHADAAYRRDLVGTLLRRALVDAHRRAAG